MNKSLAALAVLLVAAQGPPQPRPVVRPFESGNAFLGSNCIDDAVLPALRERGIEPAKPCSDETFVRRVHLDAIGTLPEPQEVRAFLENRDPDKRAKLIDALLERPEFADYWSMKWCDALRVKSEFPINLWPNAVQAYHRWVHDAIKQNRPYDRFARQLLTSSGSNFRVPEVNFYRAIQGRTPSDIAGAVALTFMGVRIDRMPKDRAAGLAAFFSRVAYKVTSEWKEEIVLLNPAPAENAKALLPDGTSVSLPPEKDPRQVFADWLIAAENPWFARAAVNRVWAWLMGRGIIHEPDDIRADNPPSIPALLACLEKEFVRAGYDLRHLYRLILNSGTYQQSSIPAQKKTEAEKYFAVCAVRRLDAEVLIDAICSITATREEYSSPIPEPFTFIPDVQRTILLADGSITSPFLEMFGRPSRDTGLFSERNNQPSDAQRLYLLNSSRIQRKIENGTRLRDLRQAAKGDARTLIRSLYVLILSRDPTKEEIDVALAYSKTKGLGPKQAVDDLAWALINSKEFQYRH